MTHYVVYDVFTDQVFGGNPLAVVIGAGSLPEQDLQRIAREFNFSETVFLFPAENPEHTAKMRIFTPTTEIPFAGHPTIGTAIALADMGTPGDMVLELGVGPIPARVKDGHASFTTKVPLKKSGTPDPALVAQCLGLNVDEITTATHPPQIASVGLPFVITELTSRDALARIRTNIDAFRQGAGTWPDSMDFAQLAYVRNAHMVEARMFAPLDNVPEDPATGSAAAALGALLEDRLGHTVNLEISQGVDMGRPSHIDVHVKEGAVTISGTARRVMSGTLEY
jgi:trans-2,3-dihydro-3-hydroxyanthranilate isomerase